MVKKGNIEQKGVDLRSLIDPSIICNVNNNNVNNIQKIMSESETIKVVNQTRDDANLIDQITYRSQQVKYVSTSQ